MSDKADAKALVYEALRLTEIAGAEQHRIPATVSNEEKRVIESVNHALMHTQG